LQCLTTVDQIQPLASHARLTGPGEAPDEQLTQIQSPPIQRAVLSRSSPAPRLDIAGTGTSELSSSQTTSTALDKSFSEVYAAAELLSDKIGIPISAVFSHWNDKFNSAIGNSPSRHIAEARDGESISMADGDQVRCSNRETEMVLTVRLRDELEHEAGMFTVIAVLAL
jgi:hypothetical protein